MSATTKRLTLGVLLCAGVAAAQDAPEPAPGPAKVERVYVPERAFERVLQRHPRGVVVRDQELDELLRRAGLRPPVAEEPAPPVAATIRQVRAAGGVTDGVATVACEADVQVLARGEVALLLPLRGAGLRRLTVDGAPARVLPDARGVRVVLRGAADPSAPETRKVAWELGARVEPGEERGAGILTLPMPAAAAGKLDLLVPGDVEVVVPQAAAPVQQTQLSRGRSNIADDARTSQGCIAWARGLEGDRTRIDGAFGGSHGEGQVVVSWRPRRSAMDVTPYVVADERSVFCVRQGVVTLDAVATLEVYRAGRDRFSIDLPPGFVARSLAIEGEEATQSQRGDRVELVLGAPRTGRFVVRLRAELTTGIGEGRQQLALQPLGFPDVQRASGLVGLAQGDGTVVGFDEVTGLERADAGDLGATPTGGDVLLRVYRRLPAPARLAVSAAPQAPRVDLVMRAVVGLGEREARALTIFQFRVQEGRVFRVSADVPGFGVETVQVRLVRGGATVEPVHQLTVTEGAVLVELQEALRAGQELFLNVQAVREEPQGLAGRTVDVPRITGSPATTFRGHVGFAPDEAFRVTGAAQAGLTAIPAAELPRAGLDVAGLVLGYRIDGPDYAGQVHLTPRETRVSSQLTTHHRVAERVVETDALIELDIEGAPVTTLELLLPAGVGRLARIEAPDLKDDRELLGTTDDGRERWRLTFEQRKAGLLPLRVRFETTAAADAGQDATVELPRVAVAGAFRERGQVAVFSSDATELQADAQGLRAVEVADVAPLPGSAFTGRPLFGYTHTAADHRLELTVKRRDAAAVLAAVVERLELKTSAAPDGLSRHEAVFHVRRLESQFFALKLPEGAQLWSVVVNGQGVKPAEQEGLKLVPLPSGPTGGLDAISVTYTLRRGAWGVTSRAELAAPELLVSRDRPVPVLRTRWTLALPDDYRVLEFAGNLRGADAGAAPPLALGVWRGVTQAQLPVLLLLLALALGASARARAALVAGLARSGTQARGAGQALAGVITLRRVLVGAGVAATAGLCLFVPTLGVARKGSAERSGSYPVPTASAPMDSAFLDDAVTAQLATEEAQVEQEMRRRVVLADMEFADAPATGGRGRGGRFEPEGAAPQQKAEERAKRDAERGEAESRQRRRASEPPAPLAPPPPAPPAAAEPMPAPRPARPQTAAPGRGPAADHGPTGSARLGRLQADDKDGPASEADEVDGFAGSNEAGAAPPEEAPAAPVLDPSALGMAFGGGAGGEGKETEPAVRKEAAVSDDLLAGRVGLRSLVLALPAVGRDVLLERPGGQARLDVQVVRDDALTVGAGALALVGLLAGVLVPGRAKVSYLGLALVGLGVLTALPYVLADARATPLLNALALGLVLAGPVHALRGLATLAARAAAEAGPRDDALRALGVLTGGLAAVCLVITGLALASRGGGSAEAAAVFGGTAGALVVICAGLVLQARWALVPALVVGLAHAGLGALVLQDAWRHGPGGAVALVGAWTVLFGLAGLSALALLLGGATASLAAGPASGPGAAPAARGVAGLLLLAALLGAPGTAKAQEAPPAGAPPRVYVPYDPARPDAKPGDVYVPEDVYLELWRRAYPDRAPTPAVPAATHAIGHVAYEGALDASGLKLEAKVAVDVLGEGWARCPLGLLGAGLKDAKVQGGKPGARVRVAPAGGLELVAEGPGSYVVTLDLVVPQLQGGHVFAAVPTSAATLRVRSTIKDRRVVVGGARAQTEERAPDGALVVDASLGDAPRVHLTLSGREVLSSGGASEAAATTNTLVWVRRGRVVALAQVTFDITGDGREGFLFDVPPGFQVTSVQTDGLRAWRLDDQGRLELALRRPTGARATVTIWGEQVLAPEVTRLKAPQLVPQGVSREAGVVGLAVEDGLRVRPLDPAAGLRQVQAGALSGLARTLGAGSVERAYGFARRPAELELELVREPVEVRADVELRATVLPDRITLQAEVGYDVRKGKVHELALAVPAGFELTQAPRGLEVREAPLVTEGAGERVLRLGLATGLSGQGKLVLSFERLLPAGAAQAPFPDLRALDVAGETTSLVVAVAQGLRVRPEQEPAGLQVRDLRSATRGAGAPLGAEWTLAYHRPHGRTPGLAASTLTLSRPTPKVTGSWTLHARLERDVVRYTLRAVYRIADAGASAFHVLLPEQVVERVRVDAVNQREVRSEPAADGQRRLTVELQSPAEEAYELGLSWEEVLDGPRFTTPHVALDGVERQARRFVLVEAAPDVQDKLVEAGLAGGLEKARASEAPVLPGPATDFAFAYRLGGDAPSHASFKLEPREVKLPPAARVPWCELTSVFTTDGVVRHRARYRVHNLRLQFLRLALPPGAEVWSVFVAGAPRRLHHEEGLTLIPLPKGTDADLSFDVELIYATPLPGDFGFGASLAPQAPALRTPDVQVERTSWTLHVPERFDVRGFAGNLKAATVAASGVKALVEEVNELKKLVDLADNASGTTRRLAEGNLEVQLARVQEQLQVCDALGAGQAERDALTKNRQELERLSGALQRRQQAQAAAPGPAADAEQVTVEGKAFDRLASGWYSNNEVTGSGANRTRWAGVPAEGPGQPQAGETWTLSIPEGQGLTLSNAEVFKGGQQGQRGASRLLDNRGYDEAQEEVARQQMQDVQRQAQTYGYGDEEMGEMAERLLRGERQDLRLEERARNVPTDVMNRFRQSLSEGDKDGDGRLNYGGLAPGSVSMRPRTADRPGGLLSEAGRSEGLLSIQVPFDTPGRAYHFATDTQDPPAITFSVYPEGLGEQARRAGRGLVLLVLLLGLFRLGLLAPLPGRGALQALLLLGAGLLAASVFLHVGGAVLALAAGLWGLRRGPGLVQPAA
ncbi:MAG: hypothetical protein M9894_16435 [Planctomycetes bacterium]|nr:hypothetical protein [Planctomycetota bacterium]